MSESEATNDRITVQLGHNFHDEFRIFVNTTPTIRLQASAQGSCIVRLPTRLSDEIFSVEIDNPIDCSSTQPFAATFWTAGSAFS
jgi:hypothetical protein